MWVASPLLLAHRSTAAHFFTMSKERLDMRIVFSGEDAKVVQRAATREGLTPSQFVRRHGLVAARKSDRREA